jgi:hypothetical protein
MCIVQYEVDEDELEEPSLPAVRNSAGICKQAMGARNGVEIEL